MKKQITMTIPEFMNMGKENTYKSSYCSKYLKSCYTILSIMFAFGSQIPMKAPVEQTNIELAKQTFEVLYVITAVGCQCIYDMTIKIASAI